MCVASKSKLRYFNTVSFVLNNILKNLKDIYSKYISVKCPTNLSLDINSSKMSFLASKLFQLPVTQIDAAFDKICNEIGFEILGFIFCTDINNCMFIKYAILEDKLCNKIINLNTNSMHCSDGRGADIL
ncbi:hypothetical protein GQX74_008556 [Glossina fuscipes]|nr:hypothetical protein GQX74_008556 [Glossina fuscipes]